MKSRLWYPQLDAYDAVRRMGLLLMRWRREPPSAERLFITDFYLATPSLIHNASLPQDVRDQLRSIQIPRPEASFITLPAAPILFQKMAEVQGTALRTMLAKGLLSTEEAKAGAYVHSEAGLSVFSNTLAALVGERELEIADFLIAFIAFVGDGSISELWPQHHSW